MEPACERLSRTLRAWRKKKGLKIAAAAAELGVSPSTWGHWETGKKFPAAKHLTLLALYIRVPVCQLLCSGDSNCNDCGKSRARDA
jgi:transcriptional regulator with XRE-family HTH domain